MSAQYVIEVSITPLCTCCGGELPILCTESKPSHDPLQRDNPHERTHRRVFVQACETCFTRKAHSHD